MTGPQKESSFVEFSGVQLPCCSVLRHTKSDGIVSQAMLPDTKEVNPMSGLTEVENCCMWRRCSQKSALLFHMEAVMWYGWKDRSVFSEPAFSTSTYTISRIPLAKALRHPHGRPEASGG
jgi:hypothetical protein